MRKKSSIFLTALTIAFILTSCGGGESDGTVENWIVLILVMLAWLKGGKK